MGTPVVVNKRSGAPFTLDIGRPHKYGNPYPLRNKHDPAERAYVLDIYRAYARRTFGMKEIVRDLEGQVLGCYCKPLDCHGDELIKLYEEAKRRLEGA